MNWKEFLKPTIGKIVLFILVFLMVPIHWTYYCPNCSSATNVTTTYPNGSSINRTVYNMGTPRWSPEYIPTIGIFFGDLYPEDIAQNISANPYFFIIFFILCYIFSCTLIWVYHKIRKK
jgi:hypothetical protein